MRDFELKVAHAKVPFTAEEVGYEGERLEVLDQHFVKLIESDIIQSASYCLSRDDKVFAHRSMGFLTYHEDDERPFMPNSFYGIYSITKLVTSVAILQLVEDGLIRLDQPVGELLEEFKPEPFNEIQVWHLLTHTSGLICDDECKPNPYRKLDAHDVMRTENWIHTLLEHGLDARPGTEWAYCSLGFNVLGEIITRVTGTFCHDYITERVLKPCDMMETHWNYLPECKDRYSTRFDWMEQMIDKAGEWEIPQIPCT